MPGQPLLQAGRGLGSLTEIRCVCAGDVLTGGQEFDGSHLVQAVQGARQFRLGEIYRFLSFQPASGWSARPMASLTGPTCPALTRLPQAKHQWLRGPCG
jgi:hypothetical protein